MSRIPFDAATVRTLAAILAEQYLTEIEMRDGDSHLRIVRAGLTAGPTIGVASVAPVAPIVVVSPDIHEAPPPAGTVPSPMVGIAYLSAEPGGPHFIAVGQPVTAGQTLLLIEAMKTFNQIKAPTAGTITQILVASGQPVEYGQPLVVIA